MSNTMLKSVVKGYIVSLGEKYNFNGLEECKLLGICDNSVTLPFNKKIEGNCKCLKYCYGLYIQCDNGKVSDDMCKSCLKEYNRLGHARYGVVDDRLKVDFSDPRGNKPLEYAKVMTKQKWSREMVLEEASRQGVELDESIFEISNNSSKRGRPKSKDEAKPVNEGKKGRPKKQEKKIEVTDDLFASLVASSINEVENKVVAVLEPIEKAEESVVAAVVEKPVKKAASSAKKSKTAKLAPSGDSVDAAKAEDGAEKAEEKPVKKSAAKKPKATADADSVDAAKAEVGAEKAEEKPVKKSAAKKPKATADADSVDAAKAEDGAEKAEEKPVKKSAAKKPKATADADSVDAAKAEVGAEKAEKSAKKAAAKKPSTKKQAVSEVIPEAPSTPRLVAEPAKVETPVVEEPKKISVKKLSYNGVVYLKSKTDGTIYDMQQNEVGKWNDVDGCIDFYEKEDEDDEEEKEEEYDE